MTAPRKKWRLSITSTTGLHHVAATSQKDAYHLVAAEREYLRTGMSMVSSIVVQVDEGRGRGWEAFERLTRDELVALP